MALIGWGKLLQDAQNRAQQLEKLHLTLAAFGITVFTLAASPILETGVMTHDARLVLATTDLCALIIAILLNGVARPFVLAAPGRDESISYAGRNIHPIEYCVRNTIAWNRVKRWTLASMLIAIASLIVLIGDTETTDSAGSWTPTYFVYTFVALVSTTSAIAVVRVLWLIFGASERQQTDLLRRSVLIDVDGYRPCAAWAYFCNMIGRRPRSDANAKTSQADG